MKRIIAGGVIVGLALGLSCAKKTKTTVQSQVEQKSASVLLNIMRLPRFLEQILLSVKNSMEGAG